jgi:tRNA (guanine-N7-)-methyltransferase
MKLEETKIILFGSGWPKDRVFIPSEFFGNQAPLEFEIGCGKGKFLVSRAEESQDRNFVGLDRVGKWMKVGDKRGTQRQLSNLVFIKAEAGEFLKILEPACADVIHMYFPDPWPKRRHRSRRLFTAAFLTLLHSKLKPGGLIELATDDADYFLQMKQSIEEAPLAWEAKRETINERIAYSHLKTNYELKFEAVGRPLHYFELRKGI